MYLLVEKVSPRILGRVTSEKVGDVVLFSPPTRLRDIVSSSGGRIADRDLFVKRIAAGPGDTVTVESSGAIQINGNAPKENRDMCGAEPLRLIERFIQPTSVYCRRGTKCLSLVTVVLYLWIHAYGVHYSPKTLLASHS